MTGDEDMFLTLIKERDGLVSFGSHRVDIGGNLLVEDMKPTFSIEMGDKKKMFWLKTHLFQVFFWQFWQFTIFSSFNFRGHFEGLNEGFSGSSFTMIAEGIIDPQK
jgi:hypothetical protein